MNTAGVAGDGMKSCPSRCRPHTSRSSCACPSRQRRPSTGIIILSVSLVFHTSSSEYVLCPWRSLRALTNRSRYVFYLVRVFYAINLCISALLRIFIRQLVASPFYPRKILACWKVPRRHFWASMLSDIEFLSGSVSSCSRLTSQKCVSPAGARIGTRIF
ncbi:hypothetical protein C8J57DRAFT_1277678 [Mycena rebaudengoi]|nr:hypothetical protein C8J57DRAFT_1277678 [Mycena rebaudengoi]